MKRQIELEEIKSHETFLKLENNYYKIKNKLLTNEIQFESSRNTLEQKHDKLKSRLSIADRHNMALESC